MVLEADYSLWSPIVLAGVTAILILIGAYIYLAFAWMTIAKKMRHRRPWLAFIPFANIALLLQIGKIHWVWAFLLLGLFFATAPLGIAMVLILMVLLVVAHWRIFQELNYPGWLSLCIVLCLRFGEIGLPLYLIIIGIIAWRN
jgi:hypothetical protein